ncbi:MAG: hypothetical protein DWI50_01725 [Chloroflexi bacterium]|nr:MAG: hypothetical protein DWI50_01725 [Chloroflexota bacterium]
MLRYSPLAVAKLNRPKPQRLPPLLPRQNLPRPLRRLRPRQLHPRRPLQPPRRAQWQSPAHSKAKPRP